VKRIEKREGRALAAVSVGLGLVQLVFIRWAEAHLARTSQVPIEGGAFLFYLALVGWLRFNSLGEVEDVHVITELRGRRIAGDKVCMIGLIASCRAGGDGNNPPTSGTPPGTYQITVRGESRNLTVSTTVTLVVS
jgi:hypothetical protein